MDLIETSLYRLYPSDSSEWVIIENNNGLKIDTEIKILNYRHCCNPSPFKLDDSKEIPCSFLCCYGGCYVQMDEIERISKILPEIKQDLLKDSLELLIKQNDKIFDPTDFDEEEMVYKILCAPHEWIYEDDPSLKNMAEEEKEALMEEEFQFPPKNHCIFLMENGYCAIHKYFVEHGEQWFAKDKKFNICTTFPLDLRPQDGTFGFMDEVADYFFEEVPCVSDDEEKKKNLGMPFVIDNMKDIISDRFSEDWWNALNQVANDFRSNKIDISSLYEEEENEDEGEEDEDENEVDEN